MARDFNAAKAQLLLGFLLAGMIGFMFDRNAIVRTTTARTTTTRKQTYDDDNTPGRKETPEEHDEGRLFPYGNLSCPFESAVYSQHYMAAKAVSLGVNITKENAFVHDAERGEMARQLSIKHRTLPTVKKVLEEGGFHNRTITIVGDSHSRQLFMSLGCLIHAADPSYIVDSDIKWVNNSEVRGPGGGMIESVSRVETENHTRVGSGKLFLKGGGVINYRWYPSDRSVKSSWTIKACRQQRRPLDGLSSNDVLVVSTGTHNAVAKYLMREYQRLFDCIRSKGPENFPKMAFMLSPYSHFPTASGAYTPVDPAEHCRRDGPYRAYQTRELSKMRPYLNSSLGMILGENLNQTELGYLHPMHGDCAHYLQPGVPDIFASDLARLLTFTNNTKIS